MNPSVRMPTSLLMVVLGTTLACGMGEGGGSKVPVDPGQLWVQPSPAFLTPGASLIFQAVPEVHSEAPYIKSATWSVLEANGGSVRAMGNGETAIYTAPSNLGTFHLKAVSEYGDSRYVPQPGTVNVVAPGGVSVSVNPASFVIKRDYTGTAPKSFAIVAPITNRRVQWSVVESGYEGPGLIYLTPDDTINSCLVLWNDAASIDRLPGNLFHVRVQSIEVPSAYALVEIQVQR